MAFAERGGWNIALPHRRDPARRSFVHRAHRCFAASPIAVANVAAPPKISVKTGFSLSIIRAQTKDMGRITSGRNRNEPIKTIDNKNLNTLGTACVVYKAKLPIDGLSDTRKIEQL
jgi:hypothetical protein